MQRFQPNKMSTFIVTLPNQGAAYYSLEVSARRYAALRMGILLVILSLSFIRTAAAGVEQVQRDVQARYHLLTGGYLQWPQCAAGQTPAPQFPKDGFYGDLVEEQDLGVKIVQDLVQKFYTDNIIYTYFIHATNGYSDLVNVSAITNYIQSDMEPIIHASDVTKINYLDELQAVATQIAKLKLIKVQATQVVDSSRDHKYNWGWNQGTDCGGVLSCLAGYQDAASAVTRHTLATSWVRLPFRHNYRTKFSGFHRPRAVMKLAHG